MKYGSEKSTRFSRAGVIVVAEIDEVELAAAPVRSGRTGRPRSRLEAHLLRDRVDQVDVEARVVGRIALSNGG